VHEIVLSVQDYLLRMKLGHFKSMLLKNPSAQLPPPEVLPAGAPLQTASSSKQDKDVIPNHYLKNVLNFHLQTNRESE
jgi:hypothetical protein